MQKRAWVLSLVLALGAYSVACTEAPARPLTADEVFESETVIEGLRDPLAKLSKSVMNLSFPDAQSLAALEPRLDVVDLGARLGKEDENILGLGLDRWQWAASAPRTGVEAADLTLWTSFLETVDFFHHFNFYNVRGRFVGADKSQYETETGFKGLAQFPSGRMGSVKGKLNIRWKHKPGKSGDDNGTWRVAKLATKEFAVIEAEAPLFSDVGDLAFDREDRARLIHSERDEGLIGLVLGIRSGQLEMDEFLDMARSQLENGAYPIVDPSQASVVDIDRDGFDDFYFVGSDGPALFFRNRGDGTFEEVSARLGLDLSKVHSATFADFDNDGDSDVFLSFFNRENGTRYLRNEDGRFVDASSSVEGGLPSWILPISVTDYNNDGLLDVYLGAYMGPFVYYMERANERAVANGEMPGDEIPWLDDAEAKEIFDRMRTGDAHPVSKLPSPSNWLLENLGGGRFRRAENVDAVEIAFSTLATAWSDIDRDGDMDLYVVNEAGPNQLVRNDEGMFTDISNEHTREIGFGMGASWGDYDNDGRADMYTTNMFSKAGTRIAEQMQSSAIVAQSARGNSLIRNAADGFYKVSGMESPAPQVEAADFGWGGGFADLNNDGYLDIYVPAGYISMPAEVATVGDS